MIEFFKLKKLPQGQRLKKTVKIFEQLEQALVSNADEPLLDDFYLKLLFETFEADYDEALKAAVSKYFSAEQKCDKSSFDKKLHLINTARHFLYSVTGVEPSEWDLIMPNAELDLANEKDIADNRLFFNNMFVYAENIRSPFNLGSIFRTADAFGAAKVFLSPDCVSPESERAKRSAMGALRYVQHERKSLESIMQTMPKNFPVIALETGGTDINSFNFPMQGIVLIGSEELGLSPEALACCSSRVTIPMHGIKASINVGVAFGIFMEKWAYAITNAK